jgi:hypothetical protein
VVLSYAPPEILEDPARLAALARDAEAGARVHHPNVLPTLGLETVDDQLVLVEPYRAGTTVRALLEAGRVPAELAVRIACDAAAGLKALHALDPGDGQPFAHGAVSAERILVAEDGTSLVTGLGVGAGRSAREDVRALAEALGEMVAGEPARPGEPLDATVVPAALATVIDHARGVGGAAQMDAAALAAALGAAFPPAGTEAVAVYVESSAPPPQASAPPPVPPARVAAHAAPAAGPIPEVSAELIAPFAGTSELPEVSAELVAPPDAARTFPVPRRQAAARRAHPAIVFPVLVILGLLLGYAASRGVLAWRAAALEAPVTEALAERPAAPAAEPLRLDLGAEAAEIPAPAALARPPPAEPEVQAPAPAAHESPARRRSQPRKLSIAVSSVPRGEILVDGKRVGRSPLVVDVSAGEHEVRLRDRAEGVDVRRKVKVQAPATPVHFNLVRGTLEVAAPSDTEIFVDGHRIGRGDQRVELWEGWHEVEARRGTARVGERFQLSAAVTSWRYVVSPTP